MAEEPTASAPSPSPISVSVAVAVAVAVAVGDDEALRLPDSADLLKHLRFSPRDGSLLLADLNEASPELQARLLQALERGDAAPRWLVTMREELRRTGALCPELQHRLGMFPVHVPPLRERREDIPLLLHRFLRE